MTEVEFLNRFQRQRLACGACTKPIKMDGPSGPVTIGQETRFSPGALFMGLDLAKELDHSVSKEGMTDA